MQLSKETLNILKNFAGINTNLMLKPGSVLQTISPQKTIFATAKVQEEFPIEFGIYDLPQFINALSLFDDPKLTFSDKMVVISSGSSSLRYYAASPETLIVPPNKKINFPSSDVSVHISGDALSQVLKTSGVLGTNDFSIVGDGKNINLVVADLNVETSNRYSIELSKSDQEFSANFKMDNLKMIVQDYDVEISSKKLSRWVSGSGDMELYVAIEATSKF